MVFPNLGILDFQGRNFVIEGGQQAGKRALTKPPLVEIPTDKALRFIVKRALIFHL